LGHPVSIRALGDALGIAVIVWGIIFIGSTRIQEWTRAVAVALDALPRGSQNQLIFGSAALVAAGVISHKLRAHYLIGTHAFDLGFFSNICWNTAHGQWFFSSILERNFMAVHANWILWPLSLIYRFYSSATVLLVAQVFLIVLAIPVLWKTTQSITGTFAGGALACFLFISSPYIGHSLANDFHPDVWQIPCLFAALWAWHHNKPTLLMVAAVSALLAKEDVSVVLCGFALFLFIQKRWRIPGGVLFVLATGALLFQTRVFIPQFLDGNQQSVLFSRYSHLGGSFQEMGENLWRHPGVYINAFFYDPAKFARFAGYFLPTAGLCFFAPLFIIPPVISVLPHLLSHAFTQLSLADIYALPSQPFIFIGAAYGAKRLLTRLDGRQTNILVGVLFIVGGIGIFRTPSYYRATTSSRVHAFQEMARLIPPDVSLAAQQNIFPHFDGRRYIQLFPIRTAMPDLQTRVLDNPEYVACDRVGKSSPCSGAVLAGDIAALEKNVSYKKIFEREDFILFQRIVDEPFRWRQAKEEYGL
jgi:uncharacterized membrane protein